MNTAAIEKFSIEARVALREGVALRAQRYRIFGDDVPAADAMIEVSGRAITAAEQRQRAELLRRVGAQGEDAFLEEMAFTWFNRLVAIRYMEVHDFLPSRTRIFSSAEGAPRPQALAEAASLDLPGLDAAEVLDLKVAGDDEALFRKILLAQCAQLAEAMPAVFRALDAADALMLPDNLLAPGSICERLVTELPDAEWATVEVIGWAYQFYISQKKDEVFAGFKKARKAESVAEIGPATQLFTPEWIVRYMVENSLGRLWMLNNPESALRGRMRYYIEPEGPAEDFIRIDSPEDIRLLDPACGSGHILVYAFDLLAAMYEERGYRPRDAAHLIIQKNLAGLEIDERAGQLAVLALTMKARELDRRFFRAEARPDVYVLESVSFTEEELERVPQVASCGDDVDVLAHLSEAGSLYQPSEGFMAALDDALATVGEGDLASQALREKLERAKETCEKLARKFDVVAANPPYMGSSNFGAWMSKWTKKAYPDTKSDLCTMFIERGLVLSKSQGSFSMITASSWMFISSFEKFRNKLLANNNIVSMIQQSTHGFPRVTVPTTMFVLETGTHAGRGSYIRLEDFDRPALQEPKSLEAIQNPDCGWFYRADAANFKSIPGTPIAYWASEAVFTAFSRDTKFDSVGHPKVGMQTSNNPKYLRLWWESDFAVMPSSSLKWIKYLKGGSYRKWYGNLDWLLLYKNSPEWITQQPNARVLPIDYLNKLKVTWTDLTSGQNSFRFAPRDTFYDISGHCYFPGEDRAFVLLAYTNTSVFSYFLKMINSSMHCQVGDVAKCPFIDPGNNANRIKELANANVSLSRADWDSFETSWDFKRNPLV